MAMKNQFRLPTSEFRIGNSDFRIATGCLVFVVLSGCGRPNSEVAIRNSDELRGWASVQIALAAGSNVTPATPDQPKPGDPCPNCGGDGVVGDGRIEAKCFACDGTGVVNSEFGIGNSEIGLSNPQSAIPNPQWTKPMPPRRGYQTWPGGDFRDGEWWEPNRHVLWRKAEGTPRQDELYDPKQGAFLRLLSAFSSLRRGGL